MTLTKEFSTHRVLSECQASWVQWHLTSLPYETQLEVFFKGDMESSEFFYKRTKNSLSLNPTTFLEISWPFSDSEALSWGIGTGLGRGISSGGSGWVAEGSQGKLELGWDWNKQISGLGNQCEGCWVVSSGSVTFVRGDLSNRLGQGEEKARTVWSMDFWPSFKMGRRGATAKTGDGSSIQSCSPRVTAGISRQNILSSSAALSPGQPLHTLAVVIFSKPKPLCH